MKQRILFLASILLATNACNDEVQQDVQEFLEPKPVASFTYEVESESDPFTIKFTNTSKDFKVSRWSFADDSTSSEVSPTHTYLKTGTFNVKLLVLNGEDFWAQREVVIKISPSHLVQLLASQNQNGKLRVHFNTVMDIAKVQWYNGIEKNSPLLSENEELELDITPGSFRNVRLKLTTPKGSVTELTMTLTNLGIVKDLTNFENTFTVSHENGGGKDGGEGSSKLIDNKWNTKFYVGGAMPDLWFKFEYVQPQIINGYVITAGNDAPERDPKDWKMQGSQDGDTWEDLHVVTGAPTIPGDRRNVNSSVTYTFNNSTAYQYYRMRITANHGSGGFQLGELRLLQLPQ